VSGSDTRPRSPAGPRRPQRRPLLADPRPLFGFFTRLRLGGPPCLEAAIAGFPLVPVVGWVTGLLGAAAALLVAGWLPPVLAAALLLAAVVGLTGLNAMDGLLDLGDGFMVHGDSERRLAAMHDHAAGVGAIGLTLVVYLTGFAALAGLADMAPAWAERSGPVPAGPALVVAAGLLLAEVLARIPYLLLAWLGRPSHSGLGSAFVRGFGPAHAAVGAGVALPVLVTGMWLGWFAVLLALAATLISAFVLLHSAQRLLGGVGGDVFGASQEIARTVALVGLVVGMAAESTW
jgi:adenosylcobinamide-GDP ribazoletransferase